MNKKLKFAKIFVGSKNPVKIASSRDAFLKYYDSVEVVSDEAESGVGRQPVNSKTFEGAERRARHLADKNRLQNLGADFFVGIEGGVINLYSRWFSFGGVCIMDNAGVAGFGSSVMFEIPPSIVGELLSGTELGDVMDRMQSSENTKQRHGAIGFFSKGVINRRKLYKDAIIAAL
ncbi:MAG: inosine/xanthosine triphosphatase, partial [Elusimicrobia bacterium CG08_land_8_20_14_0_20_44_26]